MSIQMKDMHKDRIETAATSIQKVLDDPDKETVQLVKEAQEQYDSKCTRFSYSGTSTNHVFLARTRVHFASTNPMHLIDF